MNIGPHVLAVCSWSLKPTSMAELVAKVKELGLAHVQLGLLRLIQLDDKRKHEELGHLRASGIALTGGMIAFPGEDYSTIAAIRRTGGFIPDDEWPLRRRLAKESARLARELGVGSITTHVGFVPTPGDPGYSTIRDRVREVASDLAHFDVDLLMETGQEPAAELLEFLHDLAAPNVHINFDPANMILYGAGDPIAAIATLGPHIRHVHAKDATPSPHPGQEWGQEVPLGSGQVDPAAFLTALRAAGYTGPLALEREAGTDRLADLRTGIHCLQSAADSMPR